MLQVEDLVVLHSFDPAKLYFVSRVGERLFAYNLTERAVSDFDALEHRVFARRLKPLERAIGEVIRIDKDEPFLPLGGNLARLGKVVVQLP